MQGQKGSRSMQQASQTLNQARKSMGGISKQVLALGKDENGNKLFIKVETFMESVGCPLGTGGQVSLASIKDAWADFLKDSEGRMLLCASVPQRVKIDKQSYRLHALKDGKYVPLSTWEPVEVKDNGWNAFKICYGLAQSKFAEETMELVKKSREEFEAVEAYYVEDKLTGEFVQVRVDFASGKVDRVLVVEEAA